MFRSSALALLLTHCLLSGCAKPAADVDARIGVSDPKLMQNRGLQLAAGIDLRLSSEVLEALQSGIPIVISVDLRLGRRYRYFAREINTRSYHWIINYLPLSERYTLAHAVTGEVSSYPRLRMLLTDMRQPLAYPWAQEEAQDAAQQPAWSDGRHQLQVRVRLNRLRLPAPLRLPALISSQWRLQDGWHTLLIPGTELPATAAGWTHTPQGLIHAF